MIIHDVVHTPIKRFLRPGAFQFIIYKGFLKRTIFIPIILFVLFLAPATATFGQEDGGYAPGGTSASHVLSPPGVSNISAQPLANPLDADSFQILLQKITALAAKIGIPLAAIMIIWAGFQFTTARGNEEKLKTAKTTLTLSLIGAVVLIGAWVISIALVDIARSL